jgi:hypothetical protein
MSELTPDQLEGIQDLTEYELGFIDSTLYRMGIVGRHPTMEEFALAVSELEAFVSRHRSHLMDDSDSRKAPTNEHPTKQ